MLISACTRELWVAGDNCYLFFVFLVNFRSHSENEGTSLPSADSCTSPSKMDLSYNKTAKQCLEEISGKWPDWWVGETSEFLQSLHKSFY